MSKPLTESVRDVAEQVGVDLAAAIVREFGGTRIYIPKIMREGHVLVKKLGRDWTQALIFAFGEQEISVPMHLFNERAARHDLIIKLLDEGVKVTDIARRAGCTERHIYRMIKRYHEAAPSLF